MSEVHIKGTPVNGLYEFVKSQLTPRQLEDVISKLPADQQRYFTGHVLAHDLVPLGAANRFTELAAEAIGEPLKSFSKRAGRYGAEIGLKTVYKFILLVLSIESVLKKAPLMWTRVYDGGVIEVEPGDGAATIRVKEFPSHPAVCGRITGWFEVIGERAASGKRVTISHVSCAAEGGKECVWNFTWK